MGFDPTRKQNRTPFDYWFVALGVVAVVAMLAWALL